MDLFIGIEGVGLRYSVAVASDNLGKIISGKRFIEEPISLHTTRRDVLRTRIFKLIKSVVDPIGMSVKDLSNATICIGLTGVTFPYDAYKDLPNELHIQGIEPRNLICTGDAEITFISHTQSDTGSLLLSHMGSTAYIALPNHSGIRYGGWGPVFGDEGSGYSMGRSVLSAISEESDKIIKQSYLWNEIKNWLLNPGEKIPEWKEASIIWRKRMEEFDAGGFDLPTALFSFFHEISNIGIWNLRTVVSGLVIPLMKAWKSNCPLADSIIKKSAKCLFEQYKASCDKANFDPRGKPLVLYGGVLVHNPKFRDLILEQINDNYKYSFRPIIPGSLGAMRPVFGALLFALGNSKTGDLRIPSKTIIDRLVHDQIKLHQMGELSND